MEHNLRPTARREQTIVRYDPLTSQKAFHNSQARFKCFMGPVGSGKTQALCQEVLKSVHRNPGRIGLIGAPTFGMLKDATTVALLEVLEENEIGYVLNQSNYTITFLDTRSRILLRSLDGYEHLRGSTLAWFGVDELTYTSEEAWMRLEARLRDPRAVVLGGFGVGTPKGFDWVHRRFVAEPVEGYDLIRAEPKENRYLLERTPDYYDRLEASYDDRFYRQEVLGQFLHVNAGQVYYAFDRDKNITDITVQQGETLYWSWDFNINPMSSVICQRREETVYVLDEIVLGTSSTPEVCAEFLRRYGNHRAGVLVCGDASGRHMHTISRTSDYDLIREFFSQHPALRGQVATKTSNPPVRDRVNVTNARLRNAKGERQLFIDKRCRELIKDLEQVTYKANSGQIDKGRDSERTHLSDALGYLLWHEVGPKRTIGEQGVAVI